MELRFKQTNIIVSKCPDIISKTDIYQTLMGFMYTHPHIYNIYIIIYI
jgi:hypothetical protein